MTYTDPKSDMLTRIRNATCATHEVVEIPASNLKKEGIFKIYCDLLYCWSYIFSMTFIPRRFNAFFRTWEKESTMTSRNCSSSDPITCVE